MGQGRRQIWLDREGVLEFDQGCDAGMKEYSQRRPKQAGKAKKGTASERDSLTGVWNEDSVRIKITAGMREGGSLFLCDIDRLKRINDQWGHLAGDECLRQLARTLGYMIQPGDILGRIGGDEFVIFMPGCRDQHRAQEIVKRIEERFRPAKSRGEEASFSVTAGYAVWQKGDTYRTLLGRAAEGITESKGKQVGPKERSEQPRDNYSRDAKQIRQELIEQISKPGAYCQDYETFKGIYRFIERGIMRSGQKACVILFTVVDEAGRSVLPNEKDALMERLGEDIRKTLRIGDVYTQYSSSQYLVLVIDTTEQMADLIAERVRDTFMEGDGDSSLLVHYCYRLQPARILEAEGECVP